MNLLKSLTANRLRKNVSWIFVGNVLHSLLGLVFGMYVARKLSLNDNGLITYGATVTTFVTALTCFGFSSTITREFAAHEDKSGDYLCSCMITQSVTGLFGIGVLQLVIGLLNPNEPMLRWIVLAQSMSLVISSPSLLVYWFRYSNKADTVAIWRLVAFFLACVGRMLALELSSDIMVYVWATLLETLLFSLFLIRMYVKNKPASFGFSFDIVKRMIKGSYPFIFSAVLTTIYAKTDTVMLKAMLDNETVALYTVAIYLASAISVIPSTLVEAFRPDIMEAKGKSEALYQKRFCQLYAVVAWISIAYCVFITIFAKPIILLLYTEKYLGAVSALALVVWYSAFSYFGSINNMYMVAEHKQRWVIITTLTGALANVICNLLLIPPLGIMGAALASLLTQFFANFVMMAIIPDLRPGFRIILKGICLRGVLHEGNKKN